MLGFYQNRGKNVVLHAMCPELIVLLRCVKVLHFCRNVIELSIDVVYLRPVTM